MRLNKNIAELIGMHIGDGTLYNTKWGCVWEMRGGLNEKDYYDNHVKILLKGLFPNVEFKTKVRSGGKSGCYGIQKSSKEFVEFFFKLGFSARRKTYDVKIPNYIKNANNKIKSAFIRGLFDTDGCIRFDKINKNKKHTYPRIEWSVASLNLRNDLFDLLISLDYRVYKWDTRHYSLCLAGKDNLEKFMREIKPKNTKHLNRYKFWKINGYFMPRSHSLAIAVIF